MKLLGNLLWFLLAGIWLATAWLCCAVVFAVSVIGLPFAIQCVKLALFSLWPFGRTVVKDPTASKLGVIGAILWIVPGAFLAFGYLIAGTLLAVTIIGFPFGLQAIKLAGLALQPFGKKVVRTS
ncbi:MAG: hypothetical protein RI900_1438 [Actinomycetota bacterium]